MSPYLQQASKHRSLGFDVLIRSSIQYRAAQKLQVTSIGPRSSCSIIGQTVAGPRSSCSAIGRTVVGCGWIDIGGRGWINTGGSG